MKRYICLLFLFTFLASCVSRNAYIEKIDGSVVEAVITDGNFLTVYATKDEKELIQIKREEIADIDHPGSGSIIIGSLMTLLGASALIFGTNSNGAPLAASYAFGGSLSFFGLLLAGEGLYVWLGSTSREAGSGQAMTPPGASNFSVKHSGLGYRVNF